MNTNQYGEKNPNWKGALLSRQCLACGEDFDVYQCILKRGGNAGKFCSPECNYTYKERRTMTKCHYCGKEFEVHIYDLERGKGSYCSKKCAGKAYTKNYSGENHHMHGKKFSEEHKQKMSEAQLGEKNHQWKNGSSFINGEARTSYLYKRWMRAVLRRDKWTCQMCGTRYGRLLAHHLLEFAKYPNRRFDVKNGMTVCEGCHNSLHYNIPNLKSAWVNMVHFKHINKGKLVEI